MDGTKEPPRLAARPHHGRFPVPFVTYVRPDGRPDFRAHDNSRRAECARSRLCQLCGEWMKVGDPIAMAGISTSVNRLTFGEPPAHPECLEYAAAICPWMAGAGWRPEYREAAAELTLLPTPPSERYLGIALVDDYDVVADEEGSGSIKWIGLGVREVRWVDRLSA